MHCKRKDPNGTVDFDEGKFKKNLRDFDVQGYIQNVLLGEGWQFPPRPSIPIGMDSVWLQLKGHYMKELSTTEIGDLLGYTRPLSLATASLIPGGMIALAALDKVRQGNLQARYQQSFPIHRMDAADVEELAMAFRTSWPELEDENIDYTCIYWRPRGSEEGAAWKPINASRAESADNLRICSPYDQVRVLLVMKADVKGGQYPVTFKLTRVDGWNVEGPSYREILTPLDPKDLLEGEQRFKGRVGCVLYPFYCFGPQTIPGIKPLVSDIWRGMGRLPHYLDDMRYSFEVVLGSDAGGTYLDLGGQAGGKPLTEFRVGITHQPDEDKLLTMSFLTRQCAEAKYPPMFTGCSAAEPIYARVGEAAPYVLATPEEEANRVFKAYNWSDPVELVVVVWADVTAHEDAEAEEQEWDRINVKIQLVNFEGFPDQDGPTYDSTLEYVGMLRKPLGGGEPSLATGKIESWHGSVGHVHAVRGTGKGVAEWTAQILANPVERRKLALAVDPAWEAKMVEYKIYAAHFRLDYYTLDGEHRFGLRPFGRVLTNSSGKADKYYRIGVRNIQDTSGTNGKTWQKSEAPRASTGDLTASTVRQEYEFHFAAPVAGAPAPWGDIHSPVVVEWITKEATVRDPRIRLLAPGA